MPDPIALAKFYESRTDAELLNLKREGGFTEEAERELSAELQRRNLGTHDFSRYQAQTEQAVLHEEATEKSWRGSGLLFFGRRFMTEEDRRSGIQIRTKWFAFCWIPLFPIASYRFQCRGNSRSGNAIGKERVLGRVPLDWEQVFTTWFKAAVVLVLLFLLAIGFSWYQNHGRL